MSFTPSRLARAQRVSATSLYTLDCTATVFEREFGARYRFSFRDVIEAVDEFVVHRRTLLRLAREHSLRLVFSARLDELGHVDDVRALVSDAASRLATDAAALDDDATTTTRLYAAYVFQASSAGTL